METAHLLELILISVLQLEAGISALLIYRRPGQDATLPCGSVSPDEPTCSIVRWLYDRDRTMSLTEVVNGNVRKSSARAARLSVDSSCSLVINSVTAEDVGFYTCRQLMDVNRDASTYLSLMTISPSPPDDDPKTDDEVTLKCSLLRHIDLWPCRQNSIRWVDETGNVLLGDGDGYTFIGQINCDSLLTVRHQSGPNRRYTCQFIDAKNTVAIEADYTPVFKDPSLGHINIIIGAVVGALVVLVVIAVVLIKYMKRTQVTEDVQKSTQHPDEPESNLTYVTVSHVNHLPSPYRKAKEEEVTYSTVSTLVKTETNDDPSHLYSNVSKPK